MPNYSTQASIRKESASQNPQTQQLDSKKRGSLTRRVSGSWGPEGVQDPEIPEAGIQDSAMRGLGGLKAFARNWSDYWGRAGENQNQTNASGKYGRAPGQATLPGDAGFGQQQRGSAMPQMGTPDQPAPITQSSRTQQPGTGQSQAQGLLGAIGGGVVGFLGGGPAGAISGAVAGDALEERLFGNDEEEAQDRQRKAMEEAARLQQQYKQEAAQATPLPQGYAGVQNTLTRELEGRLRGDSPLLDVLRQRIGANSAQQWDAARSSLGGLPPEAALRSRQSIDQNAQNAYALAAAQAQDQAIGQSMQYNQAVTGPYLQGQAQANQQAQYLASLAANYNKQGAEEQAAGVSYDTNAMMAFAKLLEEQQQRKKYEDQIEKWSGSLGFAGQGDADTIERYKRGG